MKEMMGIMKSELETVEMENFLELVRQSGKIYNNNKINYKKKKRDAIRWDSKLQVERKRVRALRRRYTMETDLVKRNEYCNIFKKARAKYKKDILTKKRNSFKYFINNITTSGTFGTGYKIIKDNKKTNNIDNGIIRDDGTMTDNYEGGRKLILEYNFKPSTNEEYIFKNNTLNNGIYNKDIGNSEVEKIISEMKNNKAPAYDGMTAELVKVIYNTEKELLMDIFNKIWHSSKFSDIWKITTITLIPKENKDNNLRENYRPISLLPVWEKVLDKLITNKLMSFLEVRNILNPSQFGFRKKDSTVDALNMVKTYIDDNLRNKQIVCMLSLYIINVFSSIYRNDILEIMDNYGLPDKLKFIIADYLKNRKIKISDTEFLDFNIGVPQGSSLGPTLWLLIINELLLSARGKDNKFSRVCG